jgi:acyl carrier protein
MPDSFTEIQLVGLLKKLADDTLDIDLGDAGPNTRLDSLGMDSLDRLELITAVEDELSIRVPDDQASGLETVGDLVQCLLGLQDQVPGQLAEGAESGSQP